jgi:hypothetical protein
MTKKLKTKTGTVHLITTKTFFPDIFFIGNCKGGEKLVGTKFMFCLFFPDVHADY